MRNFNLVRDIDVSGVSGTGLVAQGTVFDNGKVAMCWLTDTSSIAVYDELAHVAIIHGHNGATYIEWADNGKVESLGGPKVTFKEISGAIDVTSTYGNPARIQVKNDIK